MNKQKRCLKIIKLDTVTSTNDYARELGEKGEREITIVSAREQTMGEGRRKRKWYSPKDKGIYMSFLLRPLNVKEITFLPLLAAYAVVKALTSYADIKIKWPNDLILDGKKVGGILLKIQTTGNKDAFVVVGLGLNVNTSKQELPPQATSLFCTTQRQYQLQHIFDKIVGEFLLWYQVFNKGATKDIIKKISKHMDTLNKKVKVLMNKKWIEGIAFSFDEQGALFLKQKDNYIKRVFPEEIIHLR